MEDMEINQETIDRIRRLAIKAESSQVEEIDVEVLSQKVEELSRKWECREAEEERAIQTYNIAIQKLQHCDTKDQSQQWSNYENQMEPFHHQLDQNNQTIGDAANHNDGNLENQRNDYFTNGQDENDFQDNIAYHQGQIGNQVQQDLPEHRYYQNRPTYYQEGSHTKTQREDNGNWHENFSEQRPEDNCRGLFTNQSAQEDSIQENINSHNQGNSPQKRTYYQRQQRTNRNIGITRILLLNPGQNLYNNNKRQPFEAEQNGQKRQPFEAEVPILNQEQRRQRYCSGRTNGESQEDYRGKQQENEKIIRQDGCLQARSENCNLTKSRASKHRCHRCGQTGHFRRTCVAAEVHKRHTPHKIHRSQKRRYRNLEETQEYSRKEQTGTTPLWLKAETLQATDHGPENRILPLLEPSTTRTISEVIEIEANLEVNDIHTEEMAEISAQESTAEVIGTQETESEKKPPEQNIRKQEEQGKIHCQQQDNATKHLEQECQITTNTDARRKFYRRRAMNEETTQNIMEIIYRMEGRNKDRLSRISKSREQYVHPTSGWYDMKEEESDLRMRMSNSSNTEPESLQQRHNTTNDSPHMREEDLNNGAKMKDQKDAEHDTASDSPDRWEEDLNKRSRIRDQKDGGDRAELTCTMEKISKETPVHTWINTGLNRL